ncbi:uncharacterized protein LOC117336915 [Pecten maximus]|uniref:uncharacterized protein LOC117336915 n=1 Tax=Pecten maximus TaxID=6579 RepID=UPI001458AC33|nr:uncharacterized protein LOC117336915 [Pecten maximus]
MPTNQRYCCICSNHSSKWDGDRKIKLHRFPSDLKLRKIWIQRCRLVRKDFNFKSYDSTRICSDHFVGKSGPTHKHTVPSLFPTKTFQTSDLDCSIEACSAIVNTSVPEVHETTQIRLTEDEAIETCAPNELLDLELSRGSDDFVSESVSFDANSSRLDNSLLFNDYCGNVLGSHISSSRNQSSQTSACAVSVSTQTDSAHIVSAQVGTQTSTKTYNSVGTQVDRPTLTYEDVKRSNEDIMFYTGIPDADSFEALFDEFKDDPQLKGNKVSGRPSTLRLIDEFFLVLMRLRLGLVLEDLAYRFKTSTSSCSRIFNKWIDYLNVQLSFLIEWQDRKKIDLTMPNSFKSKYPNCRVIIDCTEIRTETPSSLQLRSMLYSDYKSHMTYKSLVGISPNGVVTFVSDLYNGSISDKQITKLSGLVDLCECGDAIMADKGFLISDLTTPKGVQLIIPPFKKKRKQLTRREVQETRQIANLRIHVERQMERIKNFRILQTNIPITMAPQASTIWKVCVKLTNLQPPLIKKK